MNKDRRPQDSQSSIEALRVERTHLSQAEFAALLCDAENLAGDDKSPTD